jgi:valyl-tRNA synthetase
MTKNVLVYVLRAIVKLLHPFIPFITEEIYQALPHKEASITISKWPTVKEEFKDELDKEAIDDMIEIITAVRNERSKANKAPKEPIALTIVAKDNAVSKTIASTTKYLFKFTNPKKLEFLTSDEGLDSKRYVIVVLPMCKIFIPTEDLVNLEEAIKKLEATKAKLEAGLARREKMLTNESFISKALQAKIDAEKAKQKEYKEQYEEVLKSLANLNA